MPRRNKKNPKRKKKYFRQNRNEAGVKAPEDNDEQHEASRHLKTGSRKKRKRTICGKKQCLSLIERTAKELKEENCAELIDILEKIFTVFASDANKRSARLELISSFLSNVKDHNARNLIDLKTQLNFVFYPKELKGLMINSRDLVRSSNDFFRFLMFGHFGDEAYLKKGGYVKVTIKEATSTDDDEKIVREAKILSQLRHENIVRILAFDKVKLRFAVEYMSLGSLSDGLVEYNFSHQKLLSIMREITSGMAYLAEKNYIHRELNIQNVLLDSEGNCKISNFAYCRYVGDYPDGIYVDEDSGLVLDLAAPEVRRANQFSTKSDMWDMSLLAWEIFFARPRMSIGSKFVSEIIRLQLLKIFVAGGCLPKPASCPFTLWLFLKRIFLAEDPNRRPTFKELMDHLKKPQLNSFF